MTLLKKFLFLKPAIQKVLRLMNRKQKISMILMLFLTIGFSIVETIGISAIMPFISVVSDASLLESGYYKTVFDFFGFDSARNFIIAFGIAIIIFYFFRGAYSVLRTYLVKRFSISIQRFFSKKAFKINLSIPYKVFAQKNSGELIQAIHNETREIGKVVFHILHISTELFTIIMIYAVILFLNWRITLIITLILLFLIVIMMLFLTKINLFQGKKKFRTNRKMHRILKESLVNVKYVKLKGSEEEVLNNYYNELKINTRSEMVTNVLNNTPRSILESLGFSFLIGVVVFLVWTTSDASMIIPTISMYALALFRILPSIQRLLHEINGIVFSEETLNNIYAILRQDIEEEGEGPVNFTSSIKFENVCFQYMTGKEVITNISLEIKKGEKVAFIGESGSGKSTFVDIITGIHKPISGTVYIDNTALTNGNIRSWRKKIGYIPQTIYLFDGTVAENVSFGSDYNEDKIKTALIKANVWGFLSQKDGINTLVGDAGIQLSGGQQQRICIARALYDDPEVLVLDEATSSLDYETEQKIMDEVYNVSANKTLIVIAHRLSTVERCDRKILIEHGRIA